MKFLIILITALNLIACGGESDDSGASAPASISGFSGVYEDFDAEDGLVDEIYMVIDTLGNISYYDYAGDSYDNYANCYWISKNEIKILNTSEQGNYRLNFLNESGSIEDTGIYGMTVNSQGINIIASDGKFNYPRSNVLVSDLNPEC